METHQLWNVNFLNQILDTMAEGLFTLDDQGIITSWNKSMEKISGYSAREAVGNTCRLIECSRCFGQMCPADINKCGVIQHGKTEAKECFIRHKDGYDIPVIKNARLARDENDQILGIVETITDLTELKKIKRTAEEAQRKLKKTYQIGNIIGKSAVMQNIFDAIRAASNSRATILIQGESGTGKELVAGAIHYNANSEARPLITVNCSALSESLLESELFGHVKGAFTGAHTDRKGRFEEADGGTVFLDEIGELTPYIQIKLLRVLQEREIERVGDSRKRKIDIRIIAATHQNLFELTQQGKFREDLFYRLKVFPIRVPPLRERREDIPILVAHFIKKGNKRENKSIAGISTKGMKKLMEYSWPGNVRELENAIEHAFVICNSDQIQLVDLPVEIRENHAGSGNHLRSAGAATHLHVHDADKPVKLTRQSLLELLDACSWNKAEVGRRIQKSRTAVWKYMKKWDIPLNPER
ncbi:MAG: sigma 54-interacting transcriptional regulator [Proteobacteria bacterium]|nr:sigma 54-interacting transcriptional regulator [Pseudomonadota bacterium]MBU1389780.1 sigma 54-interacting transcriptional regulator [Pseudomonadota bacterium]MBU1543789.1 sigma 54-interacting transcriptional regulator [Pseudomonadota bacterium]MBU2479584.1 sigma 54-interacting transcriptional regulator [Pseudomonadota bacterium]